MRATVTLGLMLLVLLLASTSAMADSTVIVGGDTATGENQPGWLFNRDPDNTTPFEFTADEASIGRGSVYVLPIGPSAPDKFIAEHFLLSSLDDLEQISYDIRLGPNSEGDPAAVSQFYLNVYTNLPGTAVDNFYECRFDFVADSASANAWTPTVITRTTVADDVQPRDGATCPATLEGMPAGSTVRMVAVTLGDTNTSDEGVDGYFDNVVVTQSGDSTTYDFEPLPPSKDACKKGGFVDYGFKNQGQCVSYVTSNGNSG